MQYVIVDCGGVKEIKSIDKPNSIRDLQERFKNATIEGDVNGKPKILSGEEIASLFGGKTVKHSDAKSLIESKVKTVHRK